MNWHTYLDELNAEGGYLQLEENELVYEGPSELLTPQRMEILQTHKAEISHFLKHDVVHSATSHGQQALWFEYQMTPDSFAYNVSVGLRMQSSVDLDALQQAFQSLVNRHPALRTTISAGEGTPVQNIHRYQSVHINMIDATTWTEEALREQVVTSYEQPFDLEQAPLWRLNLWTCSNQDHVLVWTLHHLICDGWSIWMLMEELRTLYLAAVAGEVSSLPPIEKSYHDYVAWQQQMLQSEGETLWAYWRENLSGELPILNLPTDRPRPAVSSHRGASIPIELSADLTNQLRLLAREQGVTLYMVLLATFQLLLHRYTRQEDILVGSPIAGRSQPEFAPIVGYFTSPVVMRGDLSGNPTFANFLQQVRHTVLAALKHQDFPFQLLVERLQPERTSNVSPIYQVMFVLQQPQDNLHITDLLLSSPTDKPPVVHWGDLALTGYPIPQSEGQVDLFLELFNTPDLLHGAFKYNPDIFDEPTIERMMDHFQVLLEGVVTDSAAPFEGSSQCISHLPLLTDAEYHQIVHEWNDTAVDFGEPQTIHALFEQQVDRTPDAIALVFEDVQLTYAELNTRANQLAHHLIELDVQADTLVVVAMERAIEMVVSLLAVLKAGGAYVPIDPTYPSERIHYMLADSAAPILLTQSHLLPTYDGQYDTVHIIAVDTMGEQLAAQPTQNPRTQTSSNDLAYVIYTSGSTGQPKGVANQHDGVFNRLRWTQEQFQLTIADRVLQKTPFSFDVSVWEFFWTLMSGARLVVARPEGHKDSAYLCDLIQREQITLLHFVPSMLRQFVSDPSGKNCTSLRVIITSGEALPLELAEETSQILPTTGLHNLYGPTEAAVDVSHWVYVDASKSIPIGKPIANTTLYILDTENNVLPIGIPGELHIGGVQLAREYYNRADLTAERFIEHPEFGRLYKTGDLCRWLPDGNIEYLGRTDFQVKIHGFRIELGEIENALLAQDGVHEAVVLVREESPEDKRLIAYLVADDDASVYTDTLHQKLARHLPEYMIPAAFVMLATMPLSANGKLDRRALAESSLEPDYATTQRDFVAPRDTLEEKLAAIWIDVLGVEQVGIHDNFFALGGHSLLAATMINNLQNWLQEIIHIGALFEAPTVAQLSDYLHRYYAQAIAKLGVQTANTVDDSVPMLAEAPLVDAEHAVTAETVTGEKTVDETALARVRAAFTFPALRSETNSPTPKNKPAIFVLSAPRTGSTLLRVLLAGHPDLFAPPELGLLGFQTLAERKASMGNVDPSLLDGPIYALREIENLDVDAARRQMQNFEAGQLTIPQLYHELQTRLGERRLVDKTPNYALDLSILRSAEATFTDNQYLFLMRHPYGMIHSFDEARLDLLWPQELRQQLNYTRLQLAELVWLLSYQNICAFANEIPEARQRWVRFEDLVAHPQATVEGICDFLQIEFQPTMLQPYLEKKARMTAGFTESARMLGDIKFHQHRAIDAAVADTWRQHYQADFLSDLTWQVAKPFDYTPIQSPANANGFSTGFPNGLETGQRFSHAARHRAPVARDPKRAKTGVEEPQTDVTSFVPLQVTSSNQTNSNQVTGNRTPLFLIHGVSGTVFPFTTLLPYLAAEQSVYALQARGIYDDLPLFASLEALANATIQEMKTIQANGPYAIGGWSFGGMAAFEIARQLVQQGDAVSFVGVIDAYPTALAPTGVRGSTPDQIRVYDIQTSEEELQLFFYHLGGIVGSDYGSLSAELVMNALKHDRPVNWLLQQMSQQGHAFVLEPSLIKRMWQTLKHNSQLLQRYQPQYYEGAITLFCAKGSTPPSGPQSWQPLTAQPVDAVWVDGEHMTMLNSEHVETLGRTLETRLQQVVPQKEGLYQ